jgi:uncharacterized protein (TIGR02453 family)
MMLANRGETKRAEAACFGPGLFQFLKELQDNNKRSWFQVNKHRYESGVKEPMLRFIGDFGSRLRTISRNFDADPRPVGGSMFRIYRDTRFSRDKSPYKTTAAAHFPHKAAGKDVHAPGFYLHLERGNCMGGGGLWHPDGPALEKVRDRIVKRAKDWKAVVDGRISIMGDALKRPPSGYDAEHPFVEDLKRKDFYTMSKFSDRDVCAPDFMDGYLDACGNAAPLVQFLTKALGLAW